MRHTNNIGAIDVRSKSEKAWESEVKAGKINESTAHDDFVCRQAGVRTSETRVFYEILESENGAGKERKTDADCLH